MHNAPYDDVCFQMFVCVHARVKVNDILCCETSAVCMVHNNHVSEIEWLVQAGFETKKAVPRKLLKLVDSLLDGIPLKFCPLKQTEMRKQGFDCA